MMKLCLILSLFIVICSAYSYEVKSRARYFTNTTLVCDEKAVRPLGVAFLKYWILPNGTVLQWSHPINNKHRLSVRPVYSLMITNVEDDDFGWYHCVILWDNRLFVVDSIKVGLFPDYDDIWDRYRKGAMYGGIASGVACALIVTACLFGYSYYREPDERRRRAEEKRAMYELDKTVEKFDEAVACEDEMVLPVSMIARPSLDQLGTYDTPANVQKQTVAMETVSSSRSSGFFDNKAFEIESEPPPPPFDSEAMAIESQAIPDDDGDETIVPFEEREAGCVNLVPREADHFSEQLIAMLTRRNADNFADQIL